MKIADLHIHSRYSRATSRDGTAPQLDFWARQKGIAILGTGDFTHPAWRAELRDALVPAEEGMYTLRPSLRLPGALSGETPRFVISGEISSIYKKDGKVRKVHNLILLPGLEQAETLSKRLEAIGNLHADGRPILGLDCRDLLEITLEACPDAVFIPAHIWTPHFSVFGMATGFQTLDECFGDLTGHIHALETGLSSDPDMNARVSMLDRYTLVSNSDAHSPQKLGREANLLQIDWGYHALADALEGRNPAGFAGTVEFFPEEGKYHLDGHRACGVCLTPAETVACGFRCPVCGGKLTVGVEHRVEDLADRPAGAKRPLPFESLAPLPEVIAASTGLSAASLRVQRQYLDLLRQLGPEFYILRQAPLDAVGRVAGKGVQEGLRRLRAGQVVRKPGFDGQYGVISLFSRQELDTFSGQVSLFGPAEPLQPGAAKPGKGRQPAAPAGQAPTPAPAGGLNEEQQAAAHSIARVTAVSAGPGTGKTQTLAARIEYMLDTLHIPASRLMAVTFTSQAAEGLKARLAQALGGKKAIRGLTVGTFHSIALARRTARGQSGRLLTPEQARSFAEQAARESGWKGTPDGFLQAVSALKNGMEESRAGLAHEQMAVYDWKLQAAGAVDFDDLLLDELEACRQDGKKPKVCHVLVDEFQDVSDVQYCLSRAWSRNGTLFVIGDPDQAIYGFRGASAGCFDRLAAEEPGLYTVRLVKNYRAAPEILRCAQPVISHNPGGERPLEAMRPKGGSVRLVHTRSAGDEASFLARDIADMVGGVDMLAAGRHGASTARRSFGEIAVLCRTRRQLERIERTLGRAGIPCAVAGRGDYLQATCVQGALGFLRFLQHPADTLSLHTALRAVWAVSADRIDGFAACYADAPDGLSAQELLARSEIYATDGHLRLVREQMQVLLPAWQKGKPVGLLEQWATHYGLEEDPDFSRLLQLAAFYKDLPALLDGVLLGAEGDLVRRNAQKYAAGTVTLSTLHGAKGLEFGAVYLCGLTQGVTPLEGGSRPTDLEEERRLFYVGMTRARDALVLVAQTPPSPFLGEIPAGTYAEEKGRPEQAVQLRLF